jgi:TolA-binding protein
MIRYLIPVAVVLSLVPAAPAQEAAYRDDLRFAEALRNRGDNDLALEFLEQLAKGAPPDLLKELSLEFAKTRLRVAADEPESAKRLALYRKASEDFDKFIRENPGHPRLAEANIDIARVLNFQGKTELNQAYLAEEAKDKKEIAAKARLTLEQAATKLAAAGKELQAAVGRLPDPDGIKEPKEKREAEAVKLRAETEVQQTELDRALNLYDQATCFILVSNDEGASKVLQDAKKLLEPIASGSPRQPMTWKARAWLGRILFETETTDKAHAKFQEVLLADKATPAAAEGVRLAKYFRLKVIQKAPRKEEEKTAVATIIASARNWRRDYRRYRNTPEGQGIAFLLAQTLVGEMTNNKKLPAATRNEYRDQAKVLLGELEGSENEYTDQARRMKIGLMDFTTPIEKLAKFEDLYVRSQYEAMQLAKDPEEARKARIAKIMTVLEKALATPEAKKMRNSLELNNARSMYTYWALNSGKPEAAIEVGEKFARDDPRSSQAEMSAVYALQGYAQMVAKRKDEEDGPKYRAGMFGLASYMEERWPGTLAGDLARHSIGLQLLREGNFGEAIKKLSLIAPTYASYTLVCFQISDACARAEKDSVDPILGDQKGDYRKRAIQALASMPDTALGNDPLTNQLLISGKATLGRDMFRFKRFQQMDDLATAYLARIDKLKFNDKEDDDRKIRNQLRFELVDVKLYARYGLADAAYQAGEHPRVLELLEPLVVAATKDDSPEKPNLQKNQSLGTGLLIYALKSNIKLLNIDGTDRVLGALEAVVGEEGAGITNNLKLLAVLIREQIEEIRKKGDKAALDAAIGGYVKILDKRTKNAKPSPELVRAVAVCYSGMEKHAEAAAMLEKVPDPKAKAGTPEETSHRGVQLLLLREYRLSKDKANLKKARTLIDSMLGDPKTGWGRRDLLVLVENGHLLDAEEKYAEAFAQWKQLHVRLQKQINNSAALKEKFLDCYFHMIRSYYRWGMTKTDKAARDKFTADTATQYAALERSYEGFGSDAVQKKVTELLAAEPALKAAYEAARKK